MSENQSAYAANLPEAYDRRRSGYGIRLDPIPTMDLRLRLTLQALEWCWSLQPPGTPRAVLDVAAGMGNVGQCGKHYVQKGTYTDFAYHAVEQTPAMLDHIHRHVPDATTALWRFEPDGPGLRETLEKATEEFYPHYPTVLVSHVLEHIQDQYAFLDQVMDVVRPGGFLVVCAARNDVHRGHFREYDLDRLSEVLSEFSDFQLPQLVWQMEYFMDHLVAIMRPPVTTT